MEIKMTKTQFRVYAKTTDGFFYQKDIKLFRKFILLELNKIEYNFKGEKIKVDEFIIDKNEHNILIDIWYDSNIIDKFLSRKDLINFIYKKYFEYVQQRSSGV